MLTDRKDGHLHNFLNKAKKTMMNFFSVYVLLFELMKKAWLSGKTLGRRCKDRVISAHIIVRNYYLSTYKIRVHSKMKKMYTKKKNFSGKINTEHIYAT